MKLQPSGVARLKEMINLEEKRLALQQDLESVEQQLAALQQSLVGGVSNASPVAAASPKQSLRTAPKARAKHGSLKETILSALEAAGNAGVRVKELAAAIGIKPVNVHSWFHSTSKRNPSIVKITGGHYRLSGKTAHAEPAAPKKAKPATSAKAGQEKPSSGKRGALSERILSTLAAAGKQGVTFKDLADKVDSKYKNIAIWFSTTGKKNSAIKKIGPAHFRLAA